MENNDGTTESQDIRKEELETLSAIYNENFTFKIPDYTAEFTIDIHTDSGLEVCLLNPQGHIIRTTQVNNLPPVVLKCVLPPGYPYEEPPIARIHALSLSEEEVSQLESSLLEQWSGDQVLFTMTDYLQQKAETPQKWFGKQILCSDIEFEQIVEFDQSQKQRQFDQSIFTCGICQEEFRGEKCTRFQGCKHIFCSECLREFFNSLISCGDVGKVHCPDFECGKQYLASREDVLRSDHIESERFDFQEFKELLMTPPIALDTLQKVLQDTATFDRYFQLFTDHQNAVIAKLFPSRLVSCPRKKCPAMIFRDNLASRLVVCRGCGYAFCNICRLSYHSDAIDCSKKMAAQQYHGIPIESLEGWLNLDKDSRERDIIRFRHGTDLLNRASNEYKMDKLFQEMIEDSTQKLSKCPTCDLIVQKLEGCNKMKCWSCACFFCNLCGSLLDWSLPYDHFTLPDSPCYGRLLDGIITEE